MIRLLSVRLCIAAIVILFFLNLTLRAEEIINQNLDSISLKGNSVKVEDLSPNMHDTAVLQAQHDAFETRKFVNIIRVVNGDTIKVHYGNKTEFVKLIGIDAPENRLSRKAKTEALESGENLVTIISIGIDADRFIKSFVKKGDVVTIEFDTETRDAHGGLLGYIFLADGKMLNEEIVRAGYANVVNIPHNMKYQQRLMKAQKEAKAHRRGLWE